MEVNNNVMTTIEYRSTTELGELFAALAKAQGDIRNAAKDSANPHFKSKYADLASISEACRSALSKNAIAVIQIPFNEGQDIGITTRLGHSSGQWIEGRLKVAPAKWDAQSIGSICTYIRRYALAAMAGVAPGDDDDGEAAVGRGDAPGNGTIQRPGTNGNGGQRKAAPKIEPGDVEMRTLADSIREEIDTSDKLNELNDGMFRRGEDFTSNEPKPGSDLARVKGFSDTAYHFLIDRANKRRVMIANAPPAKVLP